MPTPQQLEENRQAFEAAKAEAEATGGMVCGTYDPSGRPRYFVVPQETPDVELVDTSFSLKHGRAMTDGERTLLVLAEQRMGALAQQRSGRVEVNGARSS